MPPIQGIGGIQKCIKRSDGGVSEPNDSDLAGKFYPAKSESARSARVGHEIAEP